MTSYINKVTTPRQLNIEYKFYDPTAPQENYSEFDEYVTWLIKKCADHITGIHLESCRNESILVLLCECRSLTSISCYRCKGSFDALPTLQNLSRLCFVSCEMPTKNLSNSLRNNPNLKKLWLCKFFIFPLVFTSRLLLQYCSNRCKCID